MSMTVDGYRIPVVFVLGAGIAIIGGWDETSVAQYIVRELSA